MKILVAGLLRNKWPRLRACVLFLCFIAALSALGWQLALGYKQVKTIEHLSTINASVYSLVPNQFGNIAARFPSFAQTIIVQLVGKDVLEHPRSLMAAGINASDIDTLVQDARNLPSLQFIILKEGQLQRVDLARLRRSLPNVNIVEAAFISRIVCTR